MTTSKDVSFAHFVMQRCGEFPQHQTVVLGVPPDGMPLAYQTARLLGAPLDVIPVRALTLPTEPQSIVGAVAEGGVEIVNPLVARDSGRWPDMLADTMAVERRELGRQIVRYRRGHESVPLTGRLALIVTADLSAVETAKAVCESARTRGAARVVVAAPHGSPEVLTALRGYADEVACADAPRSSTAVVDRPDPDTTRDGPVTVLSGETTLSGWLKVPDNARGTVIFAHGSGSSRHSPRNKYVADTLNRAGVATLLLDLLAPAEEADRANVFDIELLTARLVDATAWVAARPELADLPIGYFGASTGAGAALSAAADNRVKIAAVVSRGGRPDLAGSHLKQVTSPTLLIVGGRDEAVLELNRKAQQMMSNTCELTIVPGATHLFEEPGALERVAYLAGDWFVRHLTHAPAR